jgi:hypothetical protein
LLTAGLDTTIQGIAHALHCFATWQNQWHLLRADPSLVRNAFEEVIRYTSPVQTFFRTTTKAVEIANTLIPGGEKVLLFLAAANRDRVGGRSPSGSTFGEKLLGTWVSDMAFTSAWARCWHASKWKFC